MTDDIAKLLLTQLQSIAFEMKQIRLLLEKQNKAAEAKD